MSLLPVTRRTSAARGVTRVRRHHGNWRRVSMVPRRATAPAVATRHWPSSTSSTPTTRTDYPLTPAWRWVPGCTASAPGWSTNDCPATPDSTPRRPVGQLQGGGAGQAGCRHRSEGHHRSRARHPTDPGTLAPGLLVPTSRLVLAGPRLSTPATDHQVVSVAKSHARRAERIDHPFVAFDR